MYTASGMLLPNVATPTNQLAAKETRADQTERTQEQYSKSNVNQHKLKTTVMLKVRGFCRAKKG